MLKKTQQKITPSAGIVLLRKEGVSYKVLLLRYLEHWEFPKGGLENGENKLEAAMRELAEESGISSFKFKWGKVFYETRPYGHMQKKVAYFIAETEEKDVKLMENPNSGEVEHHEYKWVDFDEAYKLLVPRLKGVLKWAFHRISLTEPEAVHVVN